MQHASTAEMIERLEREYLNAWVKSDIAFLDLALAESSVLADPFGCGHQDAETEAVGVREPALQTSGRRRIARAFVRKCSGSLLRPGAFERCGRVDAAGGTLRDPRSAVQR